MTCLHVDQFSDVVLGIWWTHSIWKLMSFFHSSLFFFKDAIAFLILSRRIVLRVFHVFLYYLQGLCFLLASFSSLLSYLSFMLEAFLKCLFSQMVTLKDLWPYHSGFLKYLMPLKGVLQANKPICHGVPLWKHLGYA